MRVNFHQIEDVAKVVWSQVNTQAKSIQNIFGSAVRGIANHLLGYLDASKQMIPTALLTRSMLQAAHVAQFKARLQKHVGDDVWSKTGLNRLVQDGLIVDQEMADSVRDHVQSNDLLRLENGLIIHSIFDDASNPDNAARLISISVPVKGEDGQEVFRHLETVPLTVIPKKATEETENVLLVNHLQRTNSASGLDESAVFGKTATALFNDVRAPMRRTNSAPELSQLHVRGERSPTSPKTPEPRLPAVVVPLHKASETSESPFCVYRQVQEHSLGCAPVAMNGFLQKKVVTAGDVVRSILTKHRIPTTQRDLSGGAFHPDIVNGFLNNDQGVKITYGKFSRGDFQPFEGLDDQNTDDQWRRLENVILGYPPSPSSNEQKFAPQVDSLTVTPDHWIDASGGVFPEPMVDVLNQKLTKMPKEAGLPEEVGSLMLGSTDDGRIPFEAFVSEIDNKKIDRMICLSNIGKHWFTLLKKNDTWLRLDQIHESIKSPEKLPVPEDYRVTPPQLAEQLTAWQVSEVICDARYWD